MGACPFIRIQCTWLQRSTLIKITVVYGSIHQVGASFVIGVCCYIVRSICINPPTLAEL